MTNLYLKKVLSEQDNAIEAVREECVKRYGERVLYPGAESRYGDDLSGSMCPAYFDTVLCWPDTPAGALAVQECPEYVAGFIKSNATRQCMENGTWYMNGNTTWTNYTTCYKSKIVHVLIDYNRTNISDIVQKYSSLVQIISETGYIVSLITLIVAFAIMLFIKKLHCARNILHMHLFASFIFRALVFIIIKVTFVEHLGFSSDLVSRNGSLYFDTNSETNNWTCKFVTSLWQYFLTANYSWIFMEGLYLHNLIFRALFADSSNSIKWYVVMGWGLPAVIVGFWVVARLLIEDTFCWTTHDRYDIFLIIGVPTMASILLNLCLFMRVSLVLYSKLRSLVSEDTRRYQKWIKSTLVLVPLFGVHYALFLSLYYSVKTNKIVEIVWLFGDLLFGSFQGFFVAILYCFLNGEVKSEIIPHFCRALTFLATNKCSRGFFPCRKKFLRSVVGRTSVCTTMSCSSLYTNGILHRNSKCRLDSLPRVKIGEKHKEHSCRPSSKRHSTVPITETNLDHYPTTRPSEPEINEETLKMVVHNDF